MLYSLGLTIACVDGPCLRDGGVVDKNNGEFALGHCEGCDSEEGREENSG